jgi:uncharacterized protein (DUF302 family)
MSASPDSGVVSFASPHTATDTVDRIASALAGAGMTVFAQIDQQAAAASAGLHMRPMNLIVFGNPRAGTPLMQAYPTLAIDLPLKALVWEDNDGKVWVSTNSPDYLQRRHAMAEPAFGAVMVLLERALS